MGNYFPTGDLDRLVKKHGPGKMNRSGNLDRVTQNGRGGLTTVAIIRVFSVLVKAGNVLTTNCHSQTKRGDPVVPSHSFTLSNRSDARKAFRRNLAKSTVAEKRLLAELI